MARAHFDFDREMSRFTTQWVTVSRVLGLLKGHKTLLDIGCGARSSVRFADTTHLVGVEVFEPYLEKARAAKTHDEFLLQDCRQIGNDFEENQFELCIAKDVIEHVTKEEGLQLLRDMERIASKRIVIFTPNGWLEQHQREEGDFQEHLSGWSAQDMRDLGFSVVGLLGPKALRTEEHALRYKPQIVWLLVSRFLQWVWCSHRPDSAAAILCWKDLDD